MVDVGPAPFVPAEPVLPFPPEPLEIFTVRNVSAVQFVQCIAYTDTPTPSDPVPALPVETVRYAIVLGTVMLTPSTEMIRSLVGVVFLTMVSRPLVSLRFHVAALKPPNTETPARSETASL